MEKRDQRKILLTGASGYVGGRLLPALEEAGYDLRCMTRRPDELRQRAAPTTEICQGDVLAADTLTGSLRDVDVAFYMVHSMGTQSDFSMEDRTAAEHFARAAEAAGVRRIIYLGGLGDEDDVDSAHLRSRHEVGGGRRGRGARSCQRFRAPRGAPVRWHCTNPERKHNGQRWTWWL